MCLYGRCACMAAAVAVIHLHRGAAPQVRGGLTEKVAMDRTVRLRFTNVGKLPPPVLQFTQVTFGYSADKVGSAALPGHCVTSWLGLLAAWLSVTVSA